MSPQVRRARLSILAAALLLPAGLASADAPARNQWVLATAKATGQGGEQFVSSLRIVNPGTEAASVTVTYLAQSLIDGSNTASGDNSGAATARLTVPGGETLAVEDVLGTLFGTSLSPFGVPAGGLKVTSDWPVSVLSRTFVANARSSTGVPGTYGFSIPAQVESQAIAPGDTAFVSYVAASPDARSGFRSNFIMLNTSSSPAVVSIDLRRGDGTSVGHRDYNLGRLSAAQAGNLSGSFGYGGPDTNLTAVVTVKSGGPVVVGCSIIDNAISSIAYAPPSKVTLPNNGVFGLAFDDGPYYVSSARLDILNELPVFLGGAVAIECRPSDPDPNARDPRYITFLGSGAGSGYPPNTVFTKGADGSFTVAGQDDFLAVSGQIRNEVDGRVSGSLTFTTTSDYTRCPGQTKTYGFQGARSSSRPAVN